MLSLTEIGGRMKSEEYRATKMENLLPDSFGLTQVLVIFGRMIELPDKTRVHDALT